MIHILAETATAAQEALVDNMIKGILGFIIVMYLVLMFLPLFEGKAIRSQEKAMLAANKKYGIELTNEDLLIFKKYSKWEKGTFIFQAVTYVGPRGDNTIDLTVDGELIRNVSLTDKHGVWILKADGVELPHIAKNTN